MKLSEVIKAIEDGSKSEFKHKFGYSLKLSHGRQHVEFIREITLLPLDGWKEVKPPRQWSEKELMLFKLLPDWAKWIAKDKSGCIWIYEDIPTLKEISGFYDSIHRSTRITYFDFLTITFEESPIYIGDLKGE